VEGPLASRSHLKRSHVPLPCCASWNYLSPPEVAAEGPTEGGTDTSLLGRCVAAPEAVPTPSTKASALATSATDRFSGAEHPWTRRLYGRARSGEA
jgi:hypothetical protein